MQHYSTPSMPSNPKVEKANTNEKLANDLFRIHAYAETLAQLCSSGINNKTLDTENLEQIFKDFAKVTDEAAAHLYKLAE